MRKLLKMIALIGLLGQNVVFGQSTIHIFPDSLVTSVNANLSPGVFYVPKTAAAATDFMKNSIQQNCIRTSIIESVLNNTSSLASCLSLLSTVQIDLQKLSFKCNKLIFIFEKMPAWLSSSSNSSPAATSGWSVLNTKPPANWHTWQKVVDSITAKIVNQFGISNAYFEIWNEPDLGSWTGTMDEYFTLYKRTYDGIKSANALAKAGGPAVNFWANNIYWQPPYGYITNRKADSSLIGQLLDSSVIWNKIPDFITWHNFSISHQEFANAANYIQQKTASLAVPDIPLVVSEWNAPAQIRDTRLASSFMLKAQLAFSKTKVSNNAIAAWQDFDPSTTEFHKDYGLLTYGAINKPAYNSILLSAKLRGTTCKISSIDAYDGLASVLNDTLFVLITNYAPPPFIEAFNHTLYQGQLNANQLDSAGYINIAGNSVLRLDSIYKGLIILPNSNAIQRAINHSISIYQHYRSIETTARQFNLRVDGYAGNYAGQLYIVDSTKNNMQFRYDSLQTAGYTQSSAISAIRLNQNISYSTIILNNGQFLFSLQPNAVCLVKIKIPEISNVNGNNMGEKSFTIYPNPTSASITITFSRRQISTDVIQIYNSIGALVKTVATNSISTVVNVSTLANGLYFIKQKNTPQQTLKFIKQ
jgi:hypothetical protein